MARHGRHGAPGAAVRAPSAPATGPFGFSRNTNHGFFPNHGLYGRSVLRGCARGGVTRNRRPDHCPHRQVTVFQFTIVHHCSPLFTIVHYCSPLFTKNIVLRQCPRTARSLLSCALWRGMGGYGAAWAAAVPRAGNTACRFSPATRHATCFFPVPPATPRRATPSPANRFSRITRHETRNTNHGLQGARRKPARIPRFSRDTNHETRITAFTLFFPPFPGISRHFSGGGGCSGTGVQAPLAGKSHKNAQNPASAGRCMGCTVSRGSRRPPGCLGCGQHKMNS